MTPTTALLESESRAPCSKHNLHAMDIRVVTNQVAEYLSFQDIQRCALVSKQWNENFEPILWRHPTSMPDWPERQKKMTEAAVERNAQFIESLRVTEATLHHKALVKRTTRLRQLAVHFLDPHHKFPIVEKVRLIQHNKRLERLVLIQGWFNWANLTPASHVHLKHLVLRKCHIERYYTKPFWELVTHIESIELDRTAVPAPNFKPTEWSFDRLRSITLLNLPELRRWHMRGPMLCDWIGRCPNLFRLCVQPGTAFTIPGRRLAEAIKQNKIPLKSLELSSFCRITEFDMGAVIGAIDGLEELKPARWMAIGELARHLLVDQHAKTLTRVHFRQTSESIPDEQPIFDPQPIFLPSVYIQRILSSCPNLIEFYAPTLEAADMLSSPWVCTQLRVLVLCIRVTDSPSNYTINCQIWGENWSPTFKARVPQLVKNESKQHKGRNRYCRKRCFNESIRHALLENARVYDRLSRLSQLEELDLSNPVRQCLRSASYLSMRFLAGFAKLGRLRKLRSFGFSGVISERCPTTLEMDWIAGRRQQHNKPADPKQEAQSLRQARLAAIRERPWPRLEKLRFTQNRSVTVQWVQQMTQQPRPIKFDTNDFHPTAELDVSPSDLSVLSIPIEPEPPLTDTENNDP